MNQRGRDDTVARVLHFVEVAAIVVILAFCTVFFVQSLQAKDSDKTDAAISAAAKSAVDDALKDMTFQAGDTVNVDINSTHSADLLAASKTLMSAVSVYANFEVTSTGFPGSFPSSGTTKKTMAGSGVIYKLDKDRGDAYIITNYHVIYYNNSSTKNNVSDDITVFLYGQEYQKYAIAATYIGGSQNYDIAVLKVTGSSVLKASQARAADIADSDAVSVLETAIAVGNPEAEGLSVTVGHVNVDSENITMTSVDETKQLSMRVMRVDAAVNEGNSGGGLYNNSGELIGIVNAKINTSSVENIAYAIPSNIATAIADNIIYYCDGTEKESVYRCILGITVTASESRAVYNTEDGTVHIVESVIVSDVTGGGLADGKLQKEDVLKSVTIEGKTYEISRTFHVVDRMLTARVGDTVTFTVLRGGEEVSVTMTITESTLTAY